MSRATVPVMNTVGGPLLHTANLPRAEREALQRRHHRGELLRLARGTYIDAHVFRQMSKKQRVFCQIFADSAASQRPVLAGYSAAVVQSIPTATRPRNPRTEIVGALPETPRRASRIQRRSITPAARAQARTVRTGFGTVGVTTPVHTALDLARWHSLADGVVALDHGLYRELFTPEQMITALDQLHGFRGVGMARQAVALATPYSESPRESELKVVLWDAGLPAPHQQARLMNEFGVLLGRVDFFWPEIAFGLEYDGEGKYRAEFGTPEAISIRDDLHRQHEIVNLGVTLHRTDRDNFRDGSGITSIKNLHRRLSNRGLALEQRFWSSAGLAWN